MQLDDSVDTLRKLEQKLLEARREYLESEEEQTECPPETIQEKEQRLLAELKTLQDNLERAFASNPVVLPETKRQGKDWRPERERIGRKRRRK